MIFPKEAANLVFDLDNTPDRIRLQRISCVDVRPWRRSGS
jgi:hypothetical protein